MTFYAFRRLSPTVQLCRVLKHGTYGAIAGGAGMKSPAYPLGLFSTNSTSTRYQLGGPATADPMPAPNMRFFLLSVVATNGYRFIYLSVGVGEN